MNLNMKEIGKRISDRRKKLGIKQNILAEKLDISNNHMSGIENGKATPSVALFVKICDELNVTPDFFAAGEYAFKSSFKGCFWLVAKVLRSRNRDDYAACATFCRVERTESRKWQNLQVMI